VFSFPLQRSETHLLGPDRGFVALVLGLTFMAQPFFGIVYAKSLGLEREEGGKCAWPFVKAAFPLC
jgi:hypothetical protein